MNCCVPPAARLAVAGVTAIELTDGAAAVTSRDAVPLAPSSRPVTVAFPEATAVAVPAPLIVATAVFDTDHVAIDVMFALDPSLYVAVAVKASVSPTAMLAQPGESATEDTALLALVFVELAAGAPQPSMNRTVRMVNKHRERQAARRRSSCEPGREWKLLRVI